MSACAQSVRTVACCSTAVCLDVQEATGLGDATEVDCIAEPLHRATEVDCSVDCVCVPPATEVDCGEAVCGATEVDCSVNHVHVSPTTEVDCGFDCRGCARRGAAEPGAASAAGEETHPPPLWARHPAVRADARPHLECDLGETGPSEGHGLISQGSEGHDGTIRGTAAWTEQVASEGATPLFPDSQPIADLPVDGSSEECHDAADGALCCEPSLESSRPFSAPPVSASEGLPVGDESLTGAFAPILAEMAVSDSSAPWSQSCEQPVSRISSKSVSPREASAPRLTSCARSGSQVGSEGSPPTRCQSGARLPLSAQEVSRREGAMVSALARGRGSSLDCSSLQRGAAAFLAHVFTRLRRRWSFSQIRRRWPCVWRPVVICRCRHGLNLASRCEFEAQARMAERVFDWDREHVRLLRRLDSGARVLILDLFCAAGGVSEGFRRMTATSVGVDASDQPFFAARFGEECFELGDALDRDRLRRLVRQLRPSAIWASPPCEASSTLTFGGKPSVAQRLIAMTRDALIEMGLPFVIENVRGAASELLPHAITLRGQEFGLETERPRLFEAGGGLELVTSSFLAPGGSALRERCCLGGRARYDRLDRFGMRMRTPCCQGNIFAVMGDAPRRSTAAECARAMGLDLDHMPYSRMAKAIPPAYASDILGQIARHVLRVRFGVPALSYDDALLDLPRARRQLSHWLRGAGGISPSRGMELTRGAAASPSVPQSGGDESVLSPETEAAEALTELEWSLTELAMREIDISWAGEVGQSLSPASDHRWLSEIRPTDRLPPGSCAARLSACHTFIRVAPSGIAQTAAELVSAVRGADSTRAVIVCQYRDCEAWFRALGRSVRIARVLELGGPRCVGDHGSSALLHGCDHAAVFAVGERLCDSLTVLDHAAVECGMDPIDLGSGGMPSAWKHAVAHSPYPRPPPEAWQGKGLPSDVVAMMTDGVVVEPFEASLPSSVGPAGAPRVDPSHQQDAGGGPACEQERIPGRFFDEHGQEHRFQVEGGQYAYRDAEHFQMGVSECDRALLVGHLEPVPDHQVDWALSVASPHPWTIVHQSADKWRAAQDYSQFMNSRVGRRPFTMTSVGDAVRVVKSSSRFAKYDLRDGFWAVPVADQSRPWLMIRHPATGRLLWCTSLPFGYSLSPYHFCAVTESVAQIFRRRVAGLGIHLFVFVDDFLIVGDDEELTRRGMQILEALFEELGLHWARHKRRGPASVMEFLGHLLVNLDGGPQVVSLTRSRQERLSDMLDAWMARRPLAHFHDDAASTAEPRELASLLGHLVFCSEVVPGGRTYMQSMLRQFVGLEVDWMRGSVRYARGVWGRIRLSDGFWRDLAWWRSALHRANCVPMHSPEAAGLAAIVGNDASDLACGELAWVDGGREEMVLRFTAAERRRPINFRELLGVVRLVERWGARLRGCTLLIDIDNTAAVGAATRMFSKSEDMQELVRRLLSLVAHHGLTLRPVHTPGEVLVRPDQTSRGVELEEPRQRFSLETFSQLEARFGPFSDFLGPERSHSQLSPLSGCGPARLWLHPSHATVSTALARVGERLTTSRASCPRGLIVVPWAPHAAWWTLTRHMECVARFGVGSRHLEENRLGRWVPISSRRPTAVFAFPRVSGTSLPLSIMCALGTTDPEEERAPFVGVGISAAASLPTGSLLYAPLREAEGEVDSDHVDAGCLYLTLEPWHGEPGSSPACVWLRRGTRRRGPGFDTFTWERGTATSRGGSYERGSEGFRPVTSELWLVNEFATQLPDRSGSSSTMRRFRFDFVTAERELSRRREIMSIPFARACYEVNEATLAAAVRGLTGAGGGPSTPQTEAEGDDADVRPMSGLRARSGDGSSVRRPPLGPASGRAGSPIPLDSASRPQPRPRRVTLSVSGQPLVLPPYAGMLCAGCRDPLAGGQVSLVTPGGTGMIHNTARCLTLARRAMAVRCQACPPADAEVCDLTESPSGGASMAGSPQVADAPLPPAEGAPRRPVRTGSDQRRAQFADRISAAARARVRRCLAGECGECREQPMVCLGTIGGSPCPARLHGMRCAQITKGHAALGCFRCPACRLRRLSPGTQLADFSEDAIRVAEETMLLELSSGAEATGGSYHDVLKLQREFMSGPASIAGSLMPLDDPEVFKMFLTWMTSSQERALSLDSLFRVAGIVMSKTTRENLTKRGDVKAHFEHLKSIHGEEAAPRTAATRLMIRHAIEVGAPARHRDPFVRVRAQLDIAVEVMLGLRVGEAMGGGDFHGLLANHLTIIRKLDSEGRPTGDEYVEALIEHSKTGFKRIITACGQSKGAAAVPLARLIREYWSLAGFSIVGRPEGGFWVEGPDYTVLRVSLKALTESSEGDEGRFDLLCSLLARSASEEARRWASYSRLRGRARMVGDSADKRYINVIGGFRDWRDLQIVAKELTLAGFGPWLSFQPGPFMRATHGKVLGCSHMPIQPGSTYGSLHDICDAAHRATHTAQSPDPELDLRGRESPLWGHHTWRRAADTFARQTMEQTGVTEADIDLIFGWMEAFYSQKMQRHYESHFDRIRRAAVTSLI